MKKLRCTRGDTLPETLSERELIPCLEAAARVAWAYAKACGRVAISRDFQFGLRFAARHCVTSFLPSAAPAVDEELPDEEWSRYAGNDELMIRVNDAADTWDEWEPKTPREVTLKSCIDNIML